MSSTNCALKSATTNAQACARPLKSMAFIVFFAGLIVAAQAFAGARPASVPADFIITPFGYYHPSCVNDLAEEDVLRQDEKIIERANGIFESIPACRYPHYRADGGKVTGDEPSVQPPNINSWVVSASSTTSSAYGGIDAEWLVPPAPSANDGQVVYLFTGLEESHDAATTILQPVLGWNADFPGAWGIASWNCCLNGTVTHGTPAPVKPGDHLFGYILSSYSCNGSSTCSTWYIGIIDETNGNGSSLTTSNHGLTFNWVFGGVLEAYNVVQCADFPGGGEISFFNQSVMNDKFVSITPKWTVNNWYSELSLTPQCNYGGSFPQQVNLTY